MPLDWSLRHLYTGARTLLVGLRDDDKLLLRSNHSASICLHASPLDVAELEI